MWPFAVRTAARLDGISKTLIEMKFSRRSDAGGQRLRHAHSSAA
jgi:hypothetical protein